MRTDHSYISRIIASTTKIVKIGAAFAFSMLLISCGGGSGNGADGLANLVADSYETELSVSTGGAIVKAVQPASSVVAIALTKQSETRISRTVYEYVFSVTFANGGVAASGVTANVTSVGSGTTVVDGSVLIGNIGESQSITPVDTITIRHDRNLAFNAGAIEWQISDVTPSPPSAIPGILLSGAPTDLALPNIEDFVAARRSADMIMVTELPNGTLFSRQQLFVALRQGATVGQVNDALNAIGGRIGFTMRKSPVMTVQVPDPGSLAALRTIAANLVASGAFEVAHEVASVQPNALPLNVSVGEAVTFGGPVFHHLATRFAPAWNAKGATQAGIPPVEAIVVDYFGRGGIDELRSEVGGPVSGIASGFDCGRDCTHGYHVLGIIGGSFEGANSTPLSKVTGGAFAGLPINVIDLAAIPTGRRLFTDEYIAIGLQEIFTRSYSGRFVMNLSLGYCVDANSCLTQAQANYYGYMWRIRMRNIWPRLPVTQPFNYQAQLIQVSAAGNGTAQTQADRNSEYNAAALLGTLGAEPPLTNALVVENREAVLNASGVPQAGGVANSSTWGGNIAAIGQNVYSFTGPASVGNKNGTSMASPQVAALAGTMLSIRPTLSSADLVAKIRNRRFLADNSSAPAIDAYAALLSMDESLTGASVRRAILRASATGRLVPGEKFTLADAVLFLKEYYPEAYSPSNAISDTTPPNFSRFDLNGDGYTGGTRRSAFDLRFDGSSDVFVPETIDRYPNGLRLSSDLNEAGLTDFEILCYYVNSDDLFNSVDRNAFDAELRNVVSPAVRRTVSCTDPAPVRLEVNTSFSGWSGFPAVIQVSGFTQTSSTLFSIFGTQGNTCGSGERGGPVFSSTVPSDALFFSAASIVGLPSGQVINRRPCSSFYAFKPNPIPLVGEEQVWINATGRGQSFVGGFTSDYEYQIRYTSGDASGVGRRCEGGVVPNPFAGFVKSFDATCRHLTGLIAIRQ